MAATFFKIMDEDGDGMCCEFGQGSYELVDKLGNVLASGGDFELMKKQPISACTIWRRLVEVKIA